MSFIGRINELQSMRSSNLNDQALLIAVYGRRRVGKTALVEKAFENRLIWKFEGIEGGTTREQIRHFLFVLGQYTGNPHKGKIPHWQDALMALNRAIGKKKLVIFFDEFQWTAAMRRKMVSIFKWAWDNHFRLHKDCVFILCGSISSFMVKKVIRSSALYGRIDREINLKPLSLIETFDYFKAAIIPQEILELYFSVGGIPQYLREFDISQSVVQNINRLAFSSSGYFFSEYQKLFISHFGGNKTYERIIQSLAHKKVQTPQQLAASSGEAYGGRFSDLLGDLEMAGFIEQRVPFDKKKNSKLKQVRLSDEFLDFHFSFVAPNGAIIEDGTLNGYELLTGRMYDQWRGYAFERLCRKHASLIANALGFRGIRYHYGPWFNRSSDNAVQCDLVFDRADRVLTLCECKYVGQLSSDIADSIVRKAEALQMAFNRPVQKVLISGRKIDVPQSVSRVCDAVIFAEDIFFFTPQ